MNRKTASTVKSASLQFLSQESHHIKVSSNSSLPLSAFERWVLIWLVEHVVELNTPAFFLRDAARGIIPSGTTTMLGGGLSATFVRQALFRPILNNPPVMTGGDQSLVPIERVMQALGSVNNRAEFTLMLTKLNGLKSRVIHPLLIAYLI
jgi:hypothetical protein